MSNRLAREASPYLLQHADNPVDWYPWSEEAFEKARREDRPIFLSVGYSTCHWCHVMEHESFENAEVAALLNAEFVPIKVDREERPDVDRVYMAYVQATTGAGGWPMSVWLTPNLEPFYGGTYFPPVSRWGRPGVVEILQELARVWKSDRLRVVGAAAQALERLRAFSQTSAVGGIAGPEMLAAGVDQLRAAFDSHHGGFGGAPKFPRPSELLFLFREFARSGSDVARDMALDTLTAMALGGMRDHIGGGFHRYSVDAAWRVPHFEKMLYDQAQLALAYLEAAQVSGRAFYAEVAEDTLRYVQREMTSPEGGFFSAEDADSVPPDEANEPASRKSEGAFYLWSDAEIGALLGNDAEIFRLRFGIRAAGNAPDDPHGEFRGRNLLYVERSIAEVSEKTGRSADDVQSALDRARLTLFEARAARPRPHLDDKLLTAWNGLMIAAFARGARVLSSGAELGSRSSSHGDTHLETAIRAATFLKKTMVEESSGRLFRRYRGGQAAINGYAEDYAFLIFGLLELFQTSADPKWLDWAVALQEDQNRLFWDDRGGGWFSTTTEDPSVLLRVKEDYDGAEPSASSVSVMNVLTLAHLTGSEGYVEKAERTFARFGPQLGQLTRALPMLAAALSAYHAGFEQIVIVGSRESRDFAAMRQALSKRYLPFSLVLPIGDVTIQNELARRLAFVESMRSIDGQATAYVCRDFVCREPVTSVVALMEQVSRSTPETGVMPSPRPGAP